jgi:hypothetical protein
MRWTEKEKQLIVELYRTHTCKEIGKMIGRTTAAVTTRLSMLGKSNKGRGRRHDVDYNYFSTLDPERAYWAGFIAADGCLYERSGGTLSFLLKRTDYKHLEKFKENCSYSGPVRFGRTPLLGKRYDNARLAISGVQKWFEDLYDHYSLTPRKSLTLQAPTITDEILLKCFIIGYFDGDGCLSYDGRPNWRISFRGNVDFLNFIKECCDRWYLAETISNVCNSDGCGRYRLSHTRSILFIKDMLKLDISRLDRKKDLFKKVLLSSEEVC